MIFCIVGAKQLMKKIVTAEYRTTSPQDQPLSANKPSSPQDQPPSANGSTSRQDQPASENGPASSRHLQEQSSTKTAKPKFKRAFKEDEIEHYIELGLGRGVSVTDPDMWKSKTTVQIRKPCKDNIVGTQECGSLEAYKKEVSTFDTIQQKLSFSFGSLGASPVKIRLDEQFSKGFSSTKVIEGQRIETRTISFQSHFYDESLKADIDQAILLTDENFLHENDLEQKLGNWLKKCREKRTGKKLDFKDDDHKLAFLKLANQLERDGKLDEVARDCSEFVEELGITHYISAIKLGACEHYFTISRSKQKHLGGGKSDKTGPLAGVGLSARFGKYFYFKGEEKRKMGRMDKEKEEVTDEAVIGFEIQPLYELVRVPYIQSLLRKAVEVYIQSQQSG